MNRKFPLHAHISVLTLLLILLVGGLIGGFGYRLACEMLTDTAADLTQRISRETQLELQSEIASSEMAVDLLSHSPVIHDKTLQERLQRLSFFQSALRHSSTSVNFYVGYDTGDFFVVHGIINPREIETLGAPHETHFVVRSINHVLGKKKANLIFLDADMHILKNKDDVEYAKLDIRNRPWYKAASATNGMTQTEPYLFFSFQKIGTSVAIRSEDGHAVVGSEILFDTLSDSLARQKITPGTKIALVSSSGLVVADGQSISSASMPVAASANSEQKRLAAYGIPALARLEGALRTHSPSAALMQQFPVNEGEWHVSVSPLILKTSSPLYLVIAIPDRELLKNAVRFRSISVLITALALALAIPLIWLMAQALAKPFATLAGMTEKIRQFDFSDHTKLRSNIKEIDELGSTVEDMKQSIRRFIDVSTALAAEPDFDHLLNKLLAETLAAANADNGILYLLDRDVLRPMAVRMGSIENPKQTLPAVPMDRPGPLLKKAILSAIPSTDALGTDDVSCLGLAAFPMANAIGQGVAVPLLNRQQHLVGLILLLPRAPLGEAQIAFVKALSGAAVSALETRGLIEAQRELFEAFIKLIAGAIDAKSEHTGGHCARVPELTKMLARAACAQTDGPYKDFQLDDEEWEAVHVAAWLHDCGKITTPEYVVDKATKLETLHDRIHEIRMRFEVLKRDAEIACLKAIIQGVEVVEAQTDLVRDLQRIDDDFSFVAGCNEGGEFMSQEKIDRLHAIAEHTWLRTLDDSLGIAHQEREKKRAAAQPLPVVEKLLADKPEHMIERRAQDRIPENNKWGIHMDIPKLLYNRGELHNLCVSRGTLSAEERYKINEHIVQTLIMLSELPFPKHLRQVPEIACGHHEKMDGTGYPRGLTRAELSPVARMMAIADIFEALTAADRPYKKGKPLSEAIRIMAAMQQNRHIDTELFELFLRSGIYREYAERFMSAEQIDVVDIEKYLGNLFRTV